MDTGPPRKKARPNSSSATTPTTKKNTNNDSTFSFANATLPNHQQQQQQLNQLAQLQQFQQFQTQQQQQQQQQLQQQAFQSLMQQNSSQPFSTTPLANGTANGTTPTFPAKPATLNGFPTQNGVPNAQDSNTNNTNNTKKPLPTEELKLPECDENGIGQYNIDPIVQVPPCKNPLPPPPGARTQSTQDILGWDSQHPYVQRWVRMSKMERSGKVKFQVVRNDGTKQSLYHLLALKNVFVKQLPNMPRPYVTRLVFDRKHESLALLMKDDKTGKYQVMGGCCYRPFKNQRFAEIAFLAISHTEQVRGYGTRLMAQTKEQVKQLGLTHLLTCADNNAVLYFKKQGFSKKICLPYELWQGYIKDYDGVTLMECKLHPRVDYLNIPRLLKAQKLALVEKMKSVSYGHVVFKGVDVRKKKGVRIEEIPGLKEIGWSLEKVKEQQEALRKVRGKGSGKDKGDGKVGGGEDEGSNMFCFGDRDPTAQKILHDHLRKVLNSIKAHACAWPFLKPVDPQETGAIDYYDVILNPMDLSTIEKRLNEGWFYITKEIFIADLKLMVNNCKQYNGKGHYVTELALTLEKVFMNKI